VASSCDNRVEELIAERNKIGGRKFKASKPAQQAITHLCALFDQLVPYAHPAPAEQDEALNLLAHICDNLNDLPISDKWAKSIVERITAMLDARYGPCFGHLSNLRTLRAIHKRLGQIIRQRTRKRGKP